LLHPKPAERLSTNSISNPEGSLEETGEAPAGKELAGLSLAAIGVVFGDIGTSPIYAFRESFHESYGLAPSQANVLGVLSLVFWSLVLVIAIKYLGFVLRADNEGEGGIIALTALVSPPSEGPPTDRKKWLLLMAGLFGAALLYGDSMITPAISVLSAIEGLGVATPVFEPYVIPITLGILVGLFAFQGRGTEGVGKVFGPVTLIWFITLGVLGVSQLLETPEALHGLNPSHAVDFFVRNRLTGLLVLGSVFLVVTGGEALYADLGHFGTRPIRLTWFGVVMPALVLNYFGQGALLLGNPEAVEQPFFLMAPGWATYPLVGIATAATVIASQAVISGAFSLSRQAVQLGYLPRLDVEHTSESRVGQIYIPAVNWVLMLAAIGLVLGFRSSSNLASAYGVAVTTDFVFTTILFAVVMRRRWSWSLPVVGVIVTVFLVSDLAFWGANLVKIPTGGWFPIVIAIIVFTLMTTWKKGREILAERLQKTVLPVEDLLADLEHRAIERVPGTAVFMYSNPEGTPPALLHNLEHNRILHERVILLTVLSEEIPYVRGQRSKVEALGEGIWRIVLRYGFAEDPDVPRALSEIELDSWRYNQRNTSFFLGQEILLATDEPGMAIWREKMFARMSRNSTRATRFFRLPSNRVVELGTRVRL